MIEVEKQDRAIKLRTARVVHELNDFCQPNAWTKGFEWWTEIDASGDSKGFIKIHGLYHVDKDTYFRDAVVFCNPVSKYFAEYNKISVWDVMKTWKDWTTVIRYAKFNPELVVKRSRNAKQVTKDLVTRDNIRENLGMEPVGDILTRKNNKNLSSEEYDWWHWVERDRKDEWKDDWYILDSVYLLRLYGQLLTALAH